MSDDAKQFKILKSKTKGKRKKVEGNTTTTTAMDIGEIRIGNKRIHPDLAKKQIQAKLGKCLNTTKYILISGCAILFVNKTITIAIKRLHKHIQCYKCHALYFFPNLTFFVVVVVTRFLVLHCLGLGSQLLSAKRQSRPSTFPESLLSLSG